MTEKQRSALLLAASSEHVLICDSDPMFGVHPRTIRALLKNALITADSLETNTSLASLSNRQLEDLDFTITTAGWRHWDSAPACWHPTAKNSCPAGADHRARAGVYSRRDDLPSASKKNPESSAGPRSVLLVTPTTDSIRI